MTRPRRSAIYLPAHSARAINKARELPCDAVILDLEDMVGPADKATARQAAVDTLQSGGFGHRELVVRINALSTPWGSDDCDAMRDLRPDAVLLPKVEHADDLVKARQQLGAAHPLWAMIETCTAVANLSSLAATSKAIGVTTWVIGSNDLAKEIGCGHGMERRGLITALSLTVMAARTGDLGILDGIYADIQDLDGLRYQAEQAADLGFNGKTIVHPKQIETVNRAFTPDEATIHWAKAVVSAFNEPANVGAGIVLVGDRFVERPHLAEAQRIVQLAAMIAATND